MESTLDGAAFFDSARLHVHLYDTLYSHAPNLKGDCAYYQSLAEGHTRVLDAACGSGRLFPTLAKPNGHLSAFDVSANLLQAAEKRARALADTGRSISITRQRLESFTLPHSFGFILIAYYGFSYLLTPEARLACLARVASHLVPDGTAVLHLPAPDLLSRQVPRHEIDALKSSFSTTQGETEMPITIEHTVKDIRYNLINRIRSVVSLVEILDDTGKILQADTSTMHYAHVDSPDIEAAAKETGLYILDVKTGFVDEVNSELIVVLTRSRAA
ncbi:MAG: class I SAM-dependent methyltransferase [Alphaproteobacteria bacterium]|nr:class I SAM-dependent methyltransferase [Alphaproteobacteria bacterium]